MPVSAKLWWLSSLPVPCSFHDRLVQLMLFQSMWVGGSVETQLS